MPDGARPEQRSERESGRTSGGSPWGRARRRRTPSASRPRSFAPTIPPATAMSGAGRRGTKCSMPDEQRDRRDADRERRQRRVRKLPDDRRRRCGRSRPCRCGRPSSFGIWSRTITHPMPALNPTRTGSEMKFATNPRRRSTGEDEDRADHQRERRRRPEKLRGIAARRDRGELRAREDRERRRRADAQRARRAEDRVDHHRHERRVEADLHGKPGDRRVGHRLRNDDRGGRQARDNVGAAATPSGSPKATRSWQRRAHFTSDAGMAKRASLNAGLTSMD